MVGRTTQCDTHNTCQCTRSRSFTLPSLTSTPQQGTPQQRPLGPPSSIRTTIAGTPPSFREGRWKALSDPAATKKGFPLTKSVGSQAERSRHATQCASKPSSACVSATATATHPPAPPHGTPRPPPRLLSHPGLGPRPTHARGLSVQSVSGRESHAAEDRSRERFHSYVQQCSCQRLIY